MNAGGCAPPSCAGPSGLRAAHARERRTAVRPPNHCASSAALRGTAPAHSLPRYGFSALPPSRTLPCATLVPAGTLCVSHTLPPITEPRPIVTRPRIVAPA